MLASLFTPTAMGKFKIQVLLGAGLLCALGMPIAARGQTMLTTTQVKQGYIGHAALTQLHRWYQFYENNAVPIENQLDILADDIKLKSGLGEAVGHEAYKKRVAEIPKTWKNSHRIGIVQINVLPQGQVQLDTLIEYLNVGASPDGSLRQGSLNYTTQLKPGNTVLPVFTSITIEPVGALTGKIYQDTYPENRLKSLMHYWLALIEDPQRRLEPFQEIFAKDFKLDFPSGVIADAAGFEKWFRDSASTVAASTHTPSNFSYKRTGDNAYDLSVDFDWQGILPNGSQMTGKTRHSWTVEDKVAERFARIKTLKVQTLKPFAPVPVN